MRQYYDLVKQILAEGVEQENRTGINSIMIPGAAMFFHMKDGYPLVGGRRVPFKSMAAELCGFYRGATSAKTFRDLGCKVWDKNANDPGLNDSNDWLRNPNRLGEDDLGPVYGAQWRSWPGYKALEVPLLTAPADVKQRFRDASAKLRNEGWEFKGVVIPEHGPQEAVYYKAIDQLAECIRTIINNPSSRRILFHGWNPAVLGEIALPACHLLYQFIPVPKTNELHLSVYIRSNDIGLGAPYNISQAALQLHLIAHLTGYKPGQLSYFVADGHIYVNQVKWLEEQLQNEILPMPYLSIDSRVTGYHDVMETGASKEDAINNAIAWLKLVEPEDFCVNDYQYHTLKEPTPPMAT